MVFVHDTRDKAGKHENIEKCIVAAGHKIIRSKLYVGDITLLHDQTKCIDIKKGFLEVSGNLFPDKRRFVSELKRAKESGIRLVILVEDDAVPTMPDLLKWVNTQPNRNKMTPDGDRIYKIILALSGSYGAEFKVCRRSNAGAEVMRILLEGH